jgi:Zn-dependent protease with chaperone function
MRRTAVMYSIAIVLFMQVLGCGTNAELEQAKKQQMDAEVRAEAALKLVADAQLAAERAIADKNASEKKAIEDRAAVERARADKEAAEKLIAEEKERATKAQEEKTRIEREQQATKKSTAPISRPPLAKSHKIPGYITAYDIMTPEDEFYFHILEKMCSGVDLAEWPLVKELVGLGQNLVDANLLATLANETIDITGQPRAAPIIKMVNECADILQVKAPNVYIDGDSEPNAYVAGLREPHVLVFTSGLLDLYDESPDELRFIIGHELGHIKAKHLKTHFLGSTFVSALVSDRSKNATFKEDFVAALSIGTLLHWYRESEYSADRAGLLCVGGDIKVAKQALLRLIHQTKPSNKLFDPSHPDFDSQLVLKNQLRLRDEPFVKVISYLRQGRQTHPFIPRAGASKSGRNL